MLEWWEGNAKDFFDWDPQWEWRVAHVQEKEEVTEDTVRDTVWCTGSIGYNKEVFRCPYVEIQRLKDGGKVYCKHLGCYNMLNPKQRRK